MNNRRKIETLDSIRNRRDPSWMREPGENGVIDALKVTLICAAIALAAIIGFGLWEGFAQKHADDAYTQQTVAECQAQGLVATVERRPDGSVIAVRCNRRSEVIRP
jgi:hypothetical protein